MKQKSQITLIREAVQMLNKYPGLTKRWPFQVNLRKLDMPNGERCVLGQLFGTYERGKEALGINNHWDDPREHGFYAWMSTPLWKAKIRQLRVSYQKVLERKRRRR